MNFTASKNHYKIKTERCSVCNMHCRFIIHDIFVVLTSVRRIISLTIASSDYALCRVPGHEFTLKTLLDYCKVISHACRAWAC